jgi:hypothetical protein
MLDIFYAIENRNLSNIVGEYYVCTKCKVVDTFPRNIQGTRCPICAKQSDIGLSFFYLSVLMLIGLLQEAYRAIPKEDSHGSEQYENIQSHSASVLIFFCTIRELLLSQFITNMMAALKLPKAIQERLNADSDTHSDRLFKLFPSLTDSKWEDVLKNLPSQNNYDWLKLNQFLKEAAEARNSFLHEGDFFAVYKNIAKECVENLFPLMELFVELNNKYVHPFYQ